MSLYPSNAELLKNRDPGSLLGPFDAKVAAVALVGGEHYLITTNTDYIPAVPSVEVPHRLFVRSDMRYGTDDPTLWPQEWTRAYCHMPAIAKKGSRPDLDIMWWNPSPSSFIVASTITRSLGRLHPRHISDLLVPINDLICQCKLLRAPSTSAVSISPLFGQLINHILVWVEQLQGLPTTYHKMAFAVTSLQRAFLELDALYHYMTKYKPHIDDYMHPLPANTPVAQCIGAFTVSPTTAQQLWAARLPFWFMRPTHAFDAANILAVVPLTEPIFLVPVVEGEDAPPVLYSGNKTEDKIAAIARAAVRTAWYHDPFDTARPHSRSPSPSPNPRQPPASSSSSYPASSSSSHLNTTSRSDHRQPHFTPSHSLPDPSNTNKSTKRAAKKPAQNPPKAARDKFCAVEAPEMPPSIPSWADALRDVDQSIPPFSSDATDKRYVLPEPALFVGPETPERRRMYLHHWNMVSDGIYFMMDQGAPQLLSGQEWRDVLCSLVTQRGQPNSRTHRRSRALEDRIRPALQVSNVSRIEGLPVPLDQVPYISDKKFREAVWRVAEASFHLEFCSLDRRASRKIRHEQVKDCFAGHMLLGTPLEMSKCGWGAAEITDRRSCIERTATLMLDWTTQSARPKIIDLVAHPTSRSSSDMLALEQAVCRYYTQAFWEYFGRAAVVPLRLDHELEDEEGEL
ncbi:hypothetical protein K438DRAFT_1760116 [Mycena galopus ATCC 62051]|nr:hypothetical protein K438DRAFT_1760116 [Mycena galopus ATCC 62051]